MANYGNFLVKDREALTKWVFNHLGYPLVAVELTQDQMDICIDDSLEIYTKYITPDIKYAILRNSDFNLDGTVIMPENTAAIFAIHEQGMLSNVNLVNGTYGLGGVLGGGGFGGIFGANGRGTQTGGASTTGGWISYELANQYMKMVKHLTAAKYDFNYNVRNRILSLSPNPREAGGNLDQDGVVIGVRMFRPDQQVLGESWVKKHTLALAKIILGNTRGKYSGVTLVGGGQVDATGIKSEGITERDLLLEELMLYDEGTQIIIG